LDKQSSSFPEEDVSVPGNKSPEANTLSFIVKIWVEQLAEEGGKATWRGSVTHVGTGERQFIKNLDEISEKIKPYLAIL
jgi:hypothetical protein